MDNTPNTIQFGQHLTIDGYGGNPKKLDDYELVKKILNELPGILGMNKLGEPLLFRAESNGKKDPGGVTGIVCIAESHISIHTFSKRKFVSADVYTCQDILDTDFILDYFKKTFELEDIEWNHLKRGSRYPAHNLVD